MPSFFVQALGETRADFFWEVSTEFCKYQIPYY